MKEQKSSAWYTRINKKKLGALLLSACLFSSFVGCSVDSIKESLNSISNPLYQGAGDTDGTLADFETGTTVGSDSNDSVEDFETEEVVGDTTSDKTTEDFETDDVVWGSDAPEGTWDDYIGENEAVLPTALNDDEYRKQDGYAYYYHYQHDATTMPIAAWSSPPPAKPGLGFPTNQITLENYQMVADAGFNTVYGLYETLYSATNVDKTNVLSALKYAEQTGLVYYVKDASVNKNLVQYAKDDNGFLERTYGWYMNMPAYGGTLLVDEPGYKDFDGFAKAQEYWNNTKYKEIKNMYINHLPSYASNIQCYYGAGETSAETIPESFSGDNWGSFVKAYVEKVKPVSYSYDFYPYRGTGATFGGYYKSLSAAREQAAAGNVPYWVFCQVGRYGGGTDGMWLTEAQVSLQVSTALAYGAKGIQWFNYWQPLETAGVNGFTANRMCAVVDHFGYKTKYYPMVQNVNLHVGAVDDVLMQCKNVGVIQVGASLDEIPNKDKLTSYGALTSVSGFGDALIGCFEYRKTGKSVFYVSSNSFTAGANLTLNFNNTYNVSMVSGTTEETKTGINQLKLDIPAGKGVLVVVG